MPKILIPVLSKRQLSKRFLLEATKTANVVVFLHVIEPSSGKTAGEIASEVEEIGALMEDAEYELRKRGIRVVFCEEWGSWEEKILNTCQREGVDEVILPRSFKLRLRGIRTRMI